ncbi:Lipid-binding serum glycoprotein, C-terminal domain and Bactericidal permeability-increasing protein, alpha/beta domain-containing protein [Strongyloides ratti]|uniref:Lipid-binding serum glycoprotein, C-terminal domain and Bactericidal permeability-increasing protein, alpha/beta domain-containing protein n=1 Tax=Strongyloides ratti TaxID=34506 RepID=A0A090KX60_STRRB|nr:Lipid-binding serum glycoprotein, C-terminal domain and Bactericidal permeability-increasing protein, alpha/beta domain-containing protein [Strongyloides ratti]CEF62006.1 Lipid-binding serum glycoprotein, C-terminal domain and Bactericidal permeability-increasing protein, alpha/beta domain-containing protein [Strongyloides ratti]
MIIRALLSCHKPPPTTQNFIILLLLFLLSFINGQYLANNYFTSPDINAGFYTDISQKAYKLMASFLTNGVFKIMKHSSIDFNITYSINPQQSIQLTSIGLDFFDYNSFNSIMEVGNNDNQLKWIGKDFKGTFKIQYKIFTEGKEISGIVPMTLDGSTFTFVLLTGINNDGHLKTELTKCIASVEKVNLQFSPTDIEFLKTTIPLIYKTIRENIHNILCPTFTEELVPIISNRLMNTPLSVSLFDHYFINYGLLGNIKHYENYTHIGHRGNVFGILRQGRTRLNDFRLPFKAMPLQTSNNNINDKMLTFTMSNYTLASLLFWMDQYRKFDFEISKDAINNTQIGGYLRTECGGEDICAGTLFPALAEKFPNGMVMIKTHTIATPIVKITSKGVFVTFDSRVDSFVEQVDKKRRFLTANMYAELSLQKINFKDYVLNGQLKIDKTKISNVVSLIDGITSESLEFLVNALNELFIADEMLKKLQSGIKLPIVLDFEQKSSSITFEENKIVISADYCFEDNCKTSEGALSASTDQDANYYDVVEG